ncbi:MAG: hypothetical protein K0R80_1610 [Clostridia bacterium]|jgi:hypothetical protein|nr:hypothetical protein [Clostridia bacterium]
MSTVTILGKIKEFLEEEVAPKIKLQKASDNNVDSYELVNPQVFIGWLPPNGCIPEGLTHTIPCLLVGLEDSSDDGNEGEINIRISAAVYSPGMHKIAGVAEASTTEFKADFQGYVDLLNLLDRTTAKLIKAQVIKNSVPLVYPVKSGMYQEQPYPFWYGWITFSVKRPAYPKVDVAKFL